MLLRTLLPLSLTLAVVGCEGASNDDHEHDDREHDDHDDDEDSGGSDDTGETSDTDDLDDTGLVDDDPIRTLTVDATSHTDWAYVDLISGSVLSLDAAGAAASTDWHLALRRFNIRTNGGDTGPGEVAVSLVYTPDGLFDGEGDPVESAFQALDAETEAAKLLEDLPEPPRGLTNQRDRISNAFGDDWYTYNFSTGVAAENDEVGWIVRGADGLTHARIRVTELDFPTRAGNGIESYQVQVEVQPDGATTFNAPVTFSGSIGATGGLDCFSFSAGDTVPCSGTGWDLQLGFLGRSFFLRSNSGDAGPGAGGAYGPVDWSVLSTFSDALTHPDDGDISNAIQADSSESLLQRESWWAYGIGGPHRLAPNFRIYVIDPDPDDDTTPRFALQVADYYNDAGAGAHITLQWAEIVDD